jgi:uncharacterized protein YjbJ (UPF0337 family)
MNKDNFEGGVRSAIGQGEKYVGSATGDKTSEVKGAYNEVAGSAQSAWGSATDAAKEAADSGSVPDLSSLRDDIAKLTQTVSALAQKQSRLPAIRWLAPWALRGIVCRSPPGLRRTSSPRWKAMSRLGSRRTLGEPSPLQA